MENFSVCLQIGDICLSGGNLFHQRGIRYFTESYFSHSFTVVPALCSNIDLCDPQISDLGTLETTESRSVVVPLERKLLEPDWILVYRPVGISKEHILDAIEAVWREHCGLMYGHLSYLWFIYFWAAQKLSIKNPAKIWKWANGGVTCSELTATYVRYLGGVFTLMIGGGDLSAVTPEILKQIMDSNPDHFKKIGWAVSRKAA